MSAFQEMSKSKREYYNILYKWLQPVIVHLIKIKLTSPEFADQFYPRLSDWTKKWKSHWLLEVNNFFGKFAERLLSLQPSTSTREKIYKEMLSDLFVEVSADFDDVFNAVISEHKNKKEIYRQALRNFFSKFYSLRKEEWYNEIKFFFIGISPKENILLLTEEELQQKFKKFLDEFTEE